MDFIFWSFALLIGLFALMIFFAVKEKKAENNFINGSNYIRVGMTISDVESIMGACDKVSYYKDGSYRCVWTYRKNGYSIRVAKGVYSHARGYTLKLTVKFDKTGTAIEVSST